MRCRHLSSLRASRGASLLALAPPASPPPRCHHPERGLLRLPLPPSSVSCGLQRSTGCALQRLEVLHLESCDLNTVPEVLSQLAALTRLHIEGNPIANGWQHLSLLALHKLTTPLLMQCSA